MARAISTVRSAGAGSAAVRLLRMMKPATPTKTATDVTAPLTTWRFVWVMCSPIRRSVSMMANTRTVTTPPA